MLVKLDNIGKLISPDLIHYVRYEPVVQKTKHIHPFKQWEGVKHYLHGYDDISHYPTELHEKHSVYSTQKLKIDIEEFKKTHLKLHQFYPGHVEFDMLLNDRAKPILEHLGMNYAILKSTYQPPGGIYPVHYDQIHNYVFNLFNINTDNDTILRFTIFLEDWKPGQFFFAEDNVLQWKKGDMYCWDNQILHGSANVGLYPKICLTITGSYNNESIILHNSH